MRRPAAWIWLAIAALCAVGIAGSLQRSLAVTSADPSILDREQVELIAAMAGLPAGTAEYERLGREIAESAVNLNENPRVTLWHIVPGALVLLLAPFQFSRRLRASHPSVHRWNGRMVLVLVAASGLAGMYLGLARPYGGAWESAATSLFGAVFFLAGARGFLAIRARQVARHREWMIRMFAVAVGISVIRVVGVASVFITGTDGIGRDSFALSLWLGWLLTLAVAELWIRRTRGDPVVESAHGLQPL
jgi:hypothetical protein